MSAEMLEVANEDELNDILSSMNEAGTDPALPFIDAHGVANIAYGMAPSGDDWAVGFSVRDPDSGTQHCCTCAHEGERCWSGDDWSPAFPIVALILGGAS
jgi:hypothetical protein